MFALRIAKIQVNSRITVESVAQLIEHGLMHNKLFSEIKLLKNNGSQYELQLYV